MTTEDLLEAMDAGVAALRTKINALAAELHAAQQEASALAAEHGMAPPLTKFSVQQSERAGGMHWTFAINPADQVTPDLPTPDQLRVRLDLAGVTKAEFATIFGVPVAGIQDWLAGERPIPCWVLPSIHMLSLLTPSARKSVLRKPSRGTHRGPASNHPFSRIEEL